MSPKTRVVESFYSVSCSHGLVLALTRPFSQVRVVVPSDHGKCLGVKFVFSKVWYSLLSVAGSLLVPFELKFVYQVQTVSVFPVSYSVFLGFTSGMWVGDRWSALFFSWCCFLVRVSKYRFKNI